MARDDITITRPNEVRVCIETAEIPDNAASVLSDLKSRLSFPPFFPNTTDELNGWKEEMSEIITVGELITLGESMIDELNELDDILVRVKIGMKKFLKDAEIFIERKEEISARVKAEGREEFTKEELESFEDIDVEMSDALERIPFPTKEKFNDLTTKLKTQSHLQFFECLIGEDFTDLVAAKTIFGLGL
jgi:hypothetical protein